MNNPIICVDFDGVIHSYTSGWKGMDVIPDPPVEGAIEWLIDHLPHLEPEEINPFDPPPIYEGPVVQIYSSRSQDPKGVQAMKEWLMFYGFPPEYIEQDILKFPMQKPPAFLTIDDRAICFNGTFPTTEEMMVFKPWNKP